MIVAISAERYLAVCYPLKARWMIQPKRTITVDIIIFILSFILNIPAFLKYSVLDVKCPSGHYVYMLRITPLYAASHVNHGYKITFSLLGVFIPLILLTVCNVRLMVEVCRSRRRFQTDKHKTTSTKATLILILIIVFYLALVCPSMMLTFFSNKVSNSDMAFFYKYRTATVVTNVTQGLNFSINFILYCVVSKPFRDNLKRMCRHENGPSSIMDSTVNRYQLVSQNTGHTRATSHSPHGSRRNQIEIENEHAADNADIVYENKVISEL